MKTKTAIDTEKVFDTINQTFKELKEGINPDELSKTAKTNILSQLDDLEKLAISIKLKIE